MFYFLTYLWRISENVIGLLLYVSVIRHPTDLSLALIIGLVALVLLLLLLLLAILIVIIATRRRRRQQAKATEVGDSQVTTSSTVSVNLSPSGSSCSRTSDQSVDDEPDADAEPPLPPPLPPLPPPTPAPTVYANLGSTPDITSTPSDEVIACPPVLPVPDDGGGGRRGAKVARSSWTESRPTAVSFSVADLRKVPPTVAKKTAKAQAAARFANSRAVSAESLVDAGLKTSSSADPLPGIGPERPQPGGPTGRYVHVPPKLHREPRGWAPASHAVPAPVKRTWGRAKAKLAAEQEKDREGISTSNTSLADDDDDVGSTLTLA